MPSLISPNQAPIASMTVDGHQALTARLDMPFLGAWTCSFTIDVDDTPPPTVGQLVDIIITPQLATAPKATFQGTVTWGAPWQGRFSFEVVGGQGGLRTVLPARSYVQGALPIDLGDIVADLVGEAEETLAAGVQSTLSGDPYQVAAWVRCEATALASLARICREFGLTWRVLDDGTIFVGEASYTPVTTSPPPYIPDPGDKGQARILTLAPDSGMLRPDTTILGRQVGRIVYSINEDGLRADVYYLGPDGMTDRDDDEAATRRLLPELPYLQGYAATITNVRTGGRVEVQCDDKSIDLLDGAMVLVGTPYTQITPEVGQRCRVVFDSGSPSQPYVIGFIQDEDADLGVARVSDLVVRAWFNRMTPSFWVSTSTEQPIEWEQIKTDVRDPLPTDEGTPLTITTGHPSVMLTSD